MTADLLCLANFPNRKAQNKKILAGRKKKRK